MSTFVQQNQSDCSGLRVAVKDCIDVKGRVSSLGCRALAGQDAAQQDADVVQKLKAAGCHVTGGLNMHELAFGMTGVNQYTGTPINPNYPDFIPGGSSSGSAVAAADDKLNFTLGTDTGGSVRLPAACCGVFGLKPTYGRISRVGVQPAQSSLDCVGVLANKAPMITRAMSILSENFNPGSLPQQLKVATIAVDAAQVMHSAVNQCAQFFDANAGEISLPLLTQAFDAGLTLIAAEASSAFGHLLETGQLGEDVATRLTRAASITQEQVAEAQKIRHAFNQQVELALDKYDLLLLPTLPHFPLAREHALEGQQDLNASVFVRPFNLSGHPAISIPIPFADGPVSVQIVAAKEQDEWLCEVAEKLSPHLAKLTLQF